LQCKTEGMHNLDVVRIMASGMCEWMICIIFALSFSLGLLPRAHLLRLGEMHYLCIITGQICLVSTAPVRFRGKGWGSRLYREREKKRFS
jgi:hypothetical protein